MEGGEEGVGLWEVSVGLCDCGRVQSVYQPTVQVRQSINQSISQTISHTANQSVSRYWFYPLRYSCCVICQYSIKINYYDDRSPAHTVLCHRSVSAGSTVLPHYIAVNFHCYFMAAAALALL